MPSLSCHIRIGLLVLLFVILGLNAGYSVASEKSADSKDPLQQVSSNCTFTVATADPSALLVAVLAANASSTPDIVCLAPVTFNFDSPYETGTSGYNAFPTISSPITINGNGAVFTRSTANALRFFEVGGDGSLTLNRLTLTNGSASSGGAIYSRGILQLNAVILSDNLASGVGGALAVYDGSVVISDTTLQNNLASSGGAYFHQKATAIIDRSTISGNRTSGGGLGGAGIYISNGVMTITNSTLSDNRTSIAALGGAILKDGGTLYINHSTFVNSYAPGGSGYTLRNSGGAAYVKNSILIDPEGLGCGYSAAHSPVYFSGQNYHDDTSCPGVSIASVTVAPLADNGGLTLTHALPALSPAIDAATDCTNTYSQAITVDQRNLRRLGVCDVGAFEATLPLNQLPPFVTYAGIVGQNFYIDVTQMLVTFNEAMNDPAGDAGANDVTSPAAYRLFYAGADGTLQSNSCTSPQGDDTAIPINSVQYEESGPFTVSLNLNNGVGLTPGNHRLVACSSLQDTNGNSLDGNSDGTGGDDYIWTMQILPPPVVSVPDSHYYVRSGITFGFAFPSPETRPPYTYTITSLPAHGTLLGSGASHTYRMDLAYSGVDSLTYTVQDANGQSGGATVYFSTAATLTATAVDTVTPYETPILIPVTIAGGFGPYTLEASFYMGTTGQILNGPNYLVYRPNMGYSGTTQIQFRAVDSYGYTSSIWTIRVVVLPDLVLADQSIGVNYETPTLLDIEATGGVTPYTYSVVSSPTQGTLSGSLPTDLTYSPAAGYTGTDTFRVQVEDARGVTRTATMTLNIPTPVTIPAGDVTALINAINTANSTPGPDTLVLASNSTYTFSAVNNTGAYGVNALPLITTEITLRGNNTTLTRIGLDMRFFEVAGSGTLTINGLTLRDGQLGNGQFGGAIFSVGSLNVVNATFQNNTANGGGAIYNNGGRLSITQSRFTNNLSNGHGGALRSGLLSGGTSPYSISVTDSVFLNNESNHNGAAIDVTSGATISGNLFANNRAFFSTYAGAIHADVGGWNQRATVINNCFTGNSHPSVYLDHQASHGDNWWSSPDGPAIYSTSGMSSPVGDSVNFPSDFLTAPILGCPSAQTQTQAVNFQQSMPITVQSPTGGTAPYTPTLYVNPAHGTLAGTLPDLTYTPTAGYSGTDTFVYRWTDATGLIAYGRVNITIATQLVAESQQLNTAGEAIAVILTAQRGTPIYTFTLVTPPTHGDLTGTSPNLTYTPNSSYVGDDSFTFQVTDSTGAISTGAVSISVGPLTAVDRNLTTPANTPLDLTLSASGGVAPIAYGAVMTPANGAVYGTAPHLTYIPNPGFSGTDSFTFQATDHLGVTDTGLVSITVGAAQPPTIIVDTFAQEQPPITNGNCTFTEAIWAVNNNVAVDACPAGSATETDVIYLPAGTYPMTVAYDTTNWTALPYINGPTIVRGAGIDQTRITRPNNPLMRFFRLYNADSLTFESLMFASGRVSNSRGGAIYNQGNLRLIGVRFAGNSAYQEGGAIYNDGGNLTVVASVFDENRVDFRGAAISSVNATGLLITGTLFQENDAFTDGNSVWVHGTNAQLRYNCIRDNFDFVQGSQYNLYYNGPSGSLDARENYHYFPNAIYQTQIEPQLTTPPDICFYLAPPPNFDIPAGDSQALANAILWANNRPSTTITLAPNSTYILPSWLVTGEGNLPTITGSITIEGNGSTIVKDTAVNSRVFMVWQGQLTLRNLTIRGGRDDEGAGVRVWQGSLITENVTFDDNVTGNDVVASGGAIDIWQGSATINNSTFTNNVSPFGGAIASFESTLNVTNSIFVGNHTIFYTNTSFMGGSSIADLRNSPGTISNNCFVENGEVSVYNDDASGLNVANNWWGAVNGPSGEGPGDGDAIGETVQYMPFLTAPPAHCANLNIILAAIDQTVRMYGFEPSLSIQLSADGGIPPYTFTVLTPPTHGSVGGTNANVTYTPSGGYTGTDLFTFRVTDTQGYTADGTVNIVIQDTTIVVNSFAQEVPFVSNGNCTLGEAIQAANTDTAVDSCMAGMADDNILLPAGVYTLTQVDNPTYGGNGLPTITSPITINGTGATITRSTNAGTPPFRIFHVSSSGILYLSGATVSNGRLDGPSTTGEEQGAGIYSTGRVILNGVTVTNNIAYYGAGGVHASSPDWVNPALEVYNSVISNNQGPTGGGIRHCRLTIIEDSQIIGNLANYGGGIYDFCGLLRVQNVVFRDNTATGHGGAIGFRNGGVDLIGSGLIFEGNSAPLGSTLYAYNNADLDIQQSCFLDQSSAGVTLPYAVMLTLANNWWGSSTGPSGPNLTGYGSNLQVDGFNRGAHLPFFTTPLPNCRIFPPTGLNQTLTALYETPLHIPTLQAIDGQPPYTFSNFTAIHGTMSGSAPDRLVYTPPAGYMGQDTITFSVTDSIGQSDQATLTINVVGPVNALGQTVATYEDITLPITLTAVRGTSPYTFSIITPPAHGTLLAQSSSADWVYVPDSGYIGEDSFIFRVTDTANDSSDGTVAINVQPVPLAAPTLLEVLDTTATVVELGWQDNNFSQQSFSVERSPNGTAWQEIGQATPAEFADTSAQCGSTYFYRVRSTRGTDASDYSNVATATTDNCPLVAPSNLTATAISLNQINLAWTDNSTGEAGFRIEHSINGATGWAQITSVDANQTSYSHLNLTCQTGHYYRVVAFRSSDAVVSPYSNTANATTLTCGPDTLALFNPDYGWSTRISSLQDLPPLNTYFSYAPGAPALGQWVMGDWNGDGQKTPGVYANNGVFYFTDSLSATASWNGIWFGLYGRPPVAGRFDGTRTNDCIGIVDSGNFPPYGLAFAMYFTCDMSGGNPPKSFQWLSVVLSDAAGFAGLGTHQFAAGDFNGDGVDSIAIRRGPFIAYTQVPPAPNAPGLPYSLSAFSEAQYIGAPSASDYGYFLSGDWDNNNIDSFGLFYQNGYFYYRNDLDWNSQNYGLQRVGSPMPTPLTATSWRYMGGTSNGNISTISSDESIVSTPSSSRQRWIESDDLIVQRVGNWQSSTTTQASGGQYLYNNGGTDSSLWLSFDGSYIEVVYLESANLGSFTVLVDGIALRTVISTNPETHFDRRVIIAYLQEGPHTVEIIPVNGMIAIDAFVVSTSR